MKKISIKQAVIAVVVLAIVYGVVAWSQHAWPFDPTSGWAKYENQKLGFSLKLPASWTGYSVASKGESVEFNMPTKEQGWDGKDTLFIIVRCTKNAYDLAQKRNTPGPCDGALLGSQDGYVYTWVSTQVQPPADIQSAYDDLPAVLATFELK